MFGSLIISWVPIKETFWRFSGKLKYIIEIKSLPLLSLANWTLGKKNKWITGWEFHNNFYFLNGLLHLRILPVSAEVDHLDFQILGCIDPFQSEPLPFPNELGAIASEDLLSKVWTQIRKHLTSETTSCKRGILFQNVVKYKLCLTNLFPKNTWDQIVVLEWLG